MQTLRHVVAGTDFSLGAEQAVDVAIRLACAAAAGFTLVHVCELGVDGSDDQQLSRCDELLRRVVADLRRRSVEVTGVLRCGRPWEKLDNVATEVGANVIVIGRHGAGRGRSVEIGSVAEQLVRSASRPVLTVACEFDRLDHGAHGTDNPHGKNEMP